MLFERSELWQSKDFLKLWAGETISVFGSFVGHSALMFAAVLVLHADALELGVLGATSLLPDVLFGLLAGVWIDRLHRRPIMIFADIARFCLLATIPLAYAFDRLTMVHLLAIVFATGTLTVFFDISYQTYLPTLVEKHAILEGNSKMTASWSVAEIAGFGISGWLVQLLTAPVAILVDAVSFLISAAALIGIRKPEPPAKQARDREGIRRELLQGGRAIIQAPILRATAWAHAVAGFSFRIYGAVFLLYATNVLGFKPGVLGVVWGVGGVTSLIGAMFAARAAARFGTGRAMMLGLAGMGAAMFLFPAAHDASVLSLLLMIGQQLGDGLFVVWDVNQVSLRQMVTPDGLLGRVNAGFRVAGQGAMLVGALAGGVLGELVGLRPTLFIGGFGLLAAALVVMASPAWSLRYALNGGVLNPIER